MPNAKKHPITHSCLTGDEARAAIAWTLDRLTVDGLTLGDVKLTVSELRKVLSSQPSIALQYKPNEWSESAQLEDEG